ncbi:hypothetical protein [Schaalia vaccimaxillae]|nr:hypothetical protein [Schaalia vaccimaxillae]
MAGSVEMFDAIVDHLEFSVKQGGKISEQVPNFVQETRINFDST